MSGLSEADMIPDLKNAEDPIEVHFYPKRKYLYFQAQVVIEKLDWRFYIQSNSDVNIMIKITF